MHVFRRVALATTIVSTVVGCSFRGDGTRGERVESASSADTVDPSTATGHSVPYPGTKDGRDVWPGTPGQLIVADALALCTLNAAGQVRGNWVTDSVLGDLRTKMSATLVAQAPPDASAPSAATLPQAWVNMRIDSTLNFDPVSQAQKAVAYTTAAQGVVAGKFEANYDTSAFANFGNGAWAVNVAQRALDVAEVNYCIGRTVNEQLQFGWSLLMQSRDQRYVIETVRERAQLGMLHLGDIAVGMASGDLTSPSVSTISALFNGQLNGPSVAAWALRSFAAGGVGPTQNGTPQTGSAVVGAWARDLTDSARLQASATETLSRMLVRSGAAQEPLPGALTTAACGARGGACDDLSPASWRQRLLALMYGGDPLTGSTPGAPVAVKAGSQASGLAWPSSTEMPYVTHAVGADGSVTPGWTPGAVRFLTVAQQFDTLTLLLKSSAYTAPSDVDTSTSVGGNGTNGVSKAAYWLYVDLETAMLGAACAPGTTCTPAAVLQSNVTQRPFPYTGALAPNLAALQAWTAWQTYQLRPEDAEDLVKALVTTLPSPAAATGFLLVGSTDLRVLHGTAQSLHFGANARIMPHSMLEAASTYGRMGRHHLSLTNNDSPYLESLYIGLVDGGDGTVLDAGRAMGAISALAELRESLAIVKSSTASIEAPFQAQLDALKGLLVSSIGASQVSLLPVEAIGSAGGVSTTLQPSGAAGTRQWSVRVLPSQADTSASGGFWGDPSLSNYSVLAFVDTPQAVAAMADVASSRAGFSSIGSLAAATNGTVFTSGAVGKLPSGEFASVIGIPESVPGTQHGVVLVARHRTKHGVSYQLLSGIMTPWTAHATTSDNSVVPLPADGQYLVTDGDLTGIALQATAMMPSDPAKPLFSGYGNPSNDLPSRDDIVSTPSGPPQLSQWLNDSMRESQTPLSDVAKNFGTFIADYKVASAGAQDIANAKQRELNSINTALATACGGVAAGGGGVDLGDAGTVAPAASCNIGFVTVDSMGPTVQEMLSFGCTDTTGAPPDIAHRPRPNWTTSANCAAPPTPGNTADPVACSLASQVNKFSFPVVVAQPVACAAWNRGMTFGSGTLAAAMARQAGAYWAYRDSVAALDKTGQAMVAQAAAADAASAAAVIAIDVATKKAQADAAAMGVTLTDAVNAVNSASTTFNDKVNEQAELNHVTSQQVLSGMATGAGAMGAVGGGIAVGAIAIGAAAGSAVPGIGTAIGAGVGAVVGLVLALGGPSAEQKLQAADATNQAKAALDAALDHLSHARDAADAAAQYDAETLALAAAQSTTANAQAAAGVATGVAGLQSQVTTTMGDFAVLVSSSTDIQNIITTTELDIQLARLATSLVVSSTRVSFGIMAEFDSAVLFNLQGDLDQARNSLLDARHAMEFLYATDFSSLADSVQSLAPPDQWVDQIYDYDLSPLHVIYGQTGAPTNIIDPTKLQNYANNLVSLMTAYKAKYGSTSSAHGLVSPYIPGPALQDSYSMIDDSGTMVTTTTPDPLAGRWLVLCAAGAACAPPLGGYCVPSGSGDAGSFAGSCMPPVPEAGVPEAGLTPLPIMGAKVQFTLDRWGNLTNVPNTAPVVGPGANRTVDQQTVNLMNGRFSRFAVNVVSASGASIVTCGGGPGCSGTDEVSYSLTQLGPYLTTGLDGRMRLLPTPSTTSLNPFMPPQYVVTATGQATDTGGNVDTAGKIDAIPKIDVRADFAALPLGGQYELSLSAGPAQDLSQIKWVQLIIEPYFY